MYVNMVKTEIKKTVSQYSTGNNDTEPVITISNQLLFEMIKLNIRSVTIPYCSKLKKKINILEHELECEIKDLEDKLLSQQNSIKTDTVLEIQKCKEDLKEIRQTALQRIILHSKANLFKLNEKPTNFFCNLGKKELCKQDYL